jgi:hypothetical protein
MSLTENDIQLIKGSLRPEFNRIDTRFEQVNKRFEEIERTLTTAFQEIIDDVYELHPTREEFKHLETRVTSLENTPPTSSHS